MAISYQYLDDVRTARLPQAIKEELRELFEQHLSKPHSRTRQSKADLGIKTQRLRCLNMVAAIEELINRGKYDISSLAKLKEKHIEYLINSWVEKGQTKGTIENKVTYLATLCQWLGKKGMVKTSSNYGVLAEMPSRSGTAMTDKSWEAVAVDATAIIGRIALEDKHVAIQMMMQLTFGLRVEEAALLRPFDVIMRIHGEVYLMIADGTKGGRPRRVEIEDESTLDVIELAKRYVNNKSKTTIPEQFTLAQWKRHYHKLVSKHGVNKKTLGITSHGLRHQYLNNLYKNLTDMDSPVRGGEKPVPDILHTARQIISEHAGHSSIYKANAYIGSHQSQKMKTSADLTDIQILQAIDDCNGNKMHAAEKLNCARSYLYKRLKDMAKLTQM